MPLYTVSSRTAVPGHLRPQLAQFIVDTHCGLTGAPETFVNVIFSQSVPLRDGIEHQLFGSVRKGRTAAMNEELRHALHAGTAALLDVVPEQLETLFFEIPAAWVMEGGHVLPEPGEEDQCEWLHQSPAPEEKSSAA